MKAVFQTRAAQNSASLQEVFAPVHDLYAALSEESRCLLDMVKRDEPLHRICRLFDLPETQILKAVSHLCGRFGIARDPMESDMEKIRVFARAHEAQTRDLQAA